MSQSMPINADVPDPEVVPQAKHRQFTAEYTLRILKEADNCSEGGCWKSARFGNSLAAYPTSRTVLRGGSGSNAASLPDRLGKPAAPPALSAVANAPFRSRLTGEAGPVMRFNDQDLRYTLWRTLIA